MSRTRVYDLMTLLHPLLIFNLSGCESDGSGTARGPGGGSPSR